MNIHRLLTGEELMEARKIANNVFVFGCELAASPQVAVGAIEILKSKGELKAHAKPSWQFPLAFWVDRGRGF